VKSIKGSDGKNRLDMVTGCPVTIPGY